MNIGEFFGGLILLFAIAPGNNVNDALAYLAGLVVVCICVEEIFNSIGLGILRGKVPWIVLIVLVLRKLGAWQPLLSLAAGAVRNAIQGTLSNLLVFGKSMHLQQAVHRHRARMRADAARGVQQEPGYRVFISLRVDEDEGAAEVLKNALEDLGISTYLCGGARPGESILQEVVAALDSCTLFIVMGTLTYGARTAASRGYSTYEELVFAVQEGKDLFLIKRIDRPFRERTARWHLPDNMVHITWGPYEAMPDDLVGQVVDRLTAAEQRRERDANMAARQ
jgi:hypothetical protein